MEKLSLKECLTGKPGSGQEANKAAGKPGLGKGRQEDAPDGVRRQLLKILKEMHKV